MSHAATPNGWTVTTPRPSWTAPLPCSNTPSAPAALPPEPTIQQIDDVEAAALLRAFKQANASLARAHETLHEKSKEMLASFQDAAHAIDGVARYTAGGSIGRATDLDEEIERRHAADGPESRRRRRVPGWLVWPPLAASAIFDGAFVGLVVQQMLNVGKQDVVYYLAYLPGGGMALALWATGTMLAENLFRHRDRSSRRPQRERLTPWTVAKRLFWLWRPERQQRQPHDLPWPRLSIPFLLTVLVLALLGVFGYVRAALAIRNFPELKSVLPIFVILLVMLSVSAIALKVLAHNPYADSSAEAAEAMLRTQQAASASRKRANDGVARHTAEWNAFQAAIARAEGEARQVLEEGCALLLDARGRRGRRGTLRLPLDGPRWPPELWTGEPGGGPRIDWALLSYARDLSRRRHPKLLEKRLAKATAAQNEQLGRRRGARPDAAHRSG